MQPAVSSFWAPPCYWQKLTPPVKRKSTRKDSAGGAKKALPELRNLAFWLILRTPSTDSYQRCQPELRRPSPTESSEPWPGSFLLLISNLELRFLESDRLCRNPRIEPRTPVFATDPGDRPPTPIIATLPKLPSRKSFLCHTCDPLPRCLLLLCPLPYCAAPGEGPYGDSLLFSSIAPTSAQCQNRYMRLLRTEPSTGKQLRLFRCLKKVSGHRVRQVLEAAPG
jgi:hypothetical protein